MPEHQTRSCSSPCTSTVQYWIVIARASFAQGRGNLRGIVLHQRKITLDTLHTAFRIELPQGDAQILAETAQGGFRQLWFDEPRAQLVGPPLPLKCLNVTGSRLSPGGRLEHRHHV